MHSLMLQQVMTGTQGCRLRRRLSSPIRTALLTTRSAAACHSVVVNSSIANAHYQTAAKVWIDCAVAM
jgi:hypothetical protein